MDNVDRKLSIAIVGGGIGGLTFALALGDCKSFEVNLYEAAPRLAEKGAGITLWERGWQIMKHLGVEADMDGLLQTPRSDAEALAFEFRKGDQEPGESFYQLFLKGGPINYHRAELQSVLLKHISSACRFHLSRRLSSYSERDDGVHLKFEDGTTATCDILVAADGIRSVARGVMMQDQAKVADAQGDDASSYLQCIQPFFSGSVAYRGLVRSSILRECMPDHRTLTTPTQYWGKNKHLVVYPISQGRVAEKDELLKQYETWENEVKVLLKCLDDPTMWAVHALKPLRSYVSSRVVLIGDAAHAMTPHQGAGASQAIEDAYILGALVNNPLCTAASVPDVLRIYNSIRQPFGNRVQAASRHQGQCYELNGPGFAHILPGDKSWSCSAEIDKEQALSKLREIDFRRAG
ncbi:FAD/NAD(P)-binding domain superfamily protein [Pleurotus pulmonarius]